MRNETPTHTDELKEGAPKKERVLIGVSCILTTKIDEITYLVLTTSPAEDIYQEKSERSGNRFGRIASGWSTEPIVLETNMLSFPGGRVEDGDKRFSTALIREILEETGLKIQPDRLELIISNTETEQIVAKPHSSPDRQGKQLYEVNFFTYQLDDAELLQLRENMNLQGRKVEVLTPKDALAQQGRLRPTAIEAINDLHYHNGLVSGEIITDCLM